MNTLLKIGIGAALIGLVVYGVKYAKKAINNFGYKIVGYGKPTVANLQATIPIQIQFDNPTPLTITIDQVIADIYILKNNMYVPAAKVSQPLTIKPGTSTQNIYPVIDLKSIFGGSLLDTLSTLTSAYATKSLQLRTDVTTIYKGIALPKQTFIQNAPLT